MKFTVMTPKERRYSFTQSVATMAESGCIGHLRADLNGGFFSSWDDHVKELKTEQFKERFNRFVNELRADVMADREALVHFLYSNIYDAVDDRSGYERWYYRVDDGEYSYMLRLVPTKGDYNMYCYCYMKEQLDKSLEG